MVNIPQSILNPNTPWKLPVRRFAFPSHPSKMKASDWDDLLGRAKQGDGEAQWRVAELHFDGCKNESGSMLVKRSPRMGREWLQRAAESGLPAAQNNLGVLIGNGKGSESARQALIWLKRAFRGGDDSAAHNAAITYREVGDFRRAVRWFRRGVRSGDDSARIQLGIHYYWGIGVRRNAAAAIGCFRRATKGKNLSEADREDARFYLAIGYLEGKGVKGSLQTARRLLKEANVDNDHPAASRVLAAI